MTQDEIIRMAREAGFREFIGICGDNYIDMLKRFAALVAAHEREACAKVCEEAIAISKVSKELLGSSEVLERAITTGAIYQAEKLVAAIRARGN